MCAWAATPSSPSVSYTHLTVAIDGAANAALLAAQILAVENAALAQKLDARRREMAAAVEEKDKKLQNDL